METQSFLDCSHNNCITVYDNMSQIHSQLSLKGHHAAHPQHFWASGKINKYCPTLTSICYIYLFINLLCIVYYTDCESREFGRVLLHNSS